VPRLDLVKKPDERARRREGRRRGLGIWKILDDRCHGLLKTNPEISLHRVRGRFKMKLEIWFDQARAM
jgi:hypothetical protein